MTIVEQLFWAEVRSPHSTVRSVAVCYALLIALAAGRLKSGDPVTSDFWAPVNVAINERFGWEIARDVRKIDRLRKMAWDINAAACNVRDAA